MKTSGPEWTLVLSNGNKEVRIGIDPGLNGGIPRIFYEHYYYTLENATPEALNQLLSSIMQQYEVGGLKPIISIEEAKELAVQYFNDADVKTTMRLEEVTTDNVTDVEYDVIDEGTLIVSVKIAYKRSISPYILDSTSQILMDAETGELLHLLLSE